MWARFTGSIQRILCSAGFSYALPECSPHRTDQTLPRQDSECSVKIKGAVLKLLYFSTFLAPTCTMHMSLSCMLEGFSSTEEANLQFLLFPFQFNNKQQRGEKSTWVPSSLMHESVCTVLFYTGQNANKCTHPSYATWVGCWYHTPLLFATSPSAAV